ncbi:alanine racemase [Rhodococcus tukisamuensis]|uniref:D-serine deaminase, pyridoxal phosphate-dependent n=1 Tax=Rhodococcus tukisamuensis TaxID=168276 RepID=A0A1G6SZP9_9NOCA|nr:alanine racemase [Rhodococcus tukisamuensis]SDD21726.1 D-serine deaminase, pyridoxal phosphate-dependent [Rhodococcus tukisamuensis]
MASPGRPTSLPELRLSLPAVRHNVGLMAAWCRDRGVELSPHIKTTMTRPIVERQLRAGAWGVTVATVRQASLALEWGTRRILIANEVIHLPDLEQLRAWLDADPTLELYLLVDSTAGLSLAGTAMRGAVNPLRVLVDVGTPGGRTGVRAVSAAVDLARECEHTPGIALAGVAGYEGVRPNRRDADVVAQVDEHCRETVAAFRAVSPWIRAERPVFSMGGSAFPDRVVDAIADLPDRGGRLIPVLRSGCYVTHDHGTYAEVSPVPGLRAALTVRAVVLSAPEPGRIVVGAGKRELPYDAGLPVLVSATDSRGVPREAARATATQIYDHHLVLADAEGLDVGDVVDLGISHPCSAFDRWPDITVVEDGRAQDVWHPQFR